MRSRSATLCLSGRLYKPLLTGGIQDHVCEVTEKDKKFKETWTVQCRPPSPCRLASPCPSIAMLFLCHHRSQIFRSRVPAAIYNMPGSKARKERRKKECASTPHPIATKAAYAEGVEDVRSAYACTRRKAEDWSKISFSGLLCGAAPQWGFLGVQKASTQLKVKQEDDSDDEREYPISRGIWRTHSPGSTPFAISSCRVEEENARHGKVQGGVIHYQVGSLRPAASRPCTGNGHQRSLKRAETALKIAQLKFKSGACAYTRFGAIHDYVL
ncbi:hypothetical protein BU23DRAFT_567369 [Bimuria novae-zelandiae CBS 107.79]|uniref:Uncharacterized protein n=1 Tax=Bimuria novae-zelandiae CBS 107.79 TaxID=1447943 RepID=A0A6A5VBP1_9PLEO|nr:hypothetical protein BU23DRAFT_567369 [Bimuria novae-zelandiae CBS 107.79]